MATRPSQPHSPLDVHVPCDDVAITAVRPLPRDNDRRVAAQAAMEIGGRAAWLAWQIEADEVLINEAQAQLLGICEDLARYGSRLPTDLHERLTTKLADAQTSAQDNDLQAVARAARKIRELAERFRNTTMA